MDSQDNSQRLREAQEERSNLLRLTREPGWKWFMGLLQTQEQNRRNQFELVPLSKMDDVLGEQFLKGELAAYRTVQVIVMARVEELESEIDDLEQEISAGRS